MDKLAHGWGITHWGMYFGLGLLIQVEVRVFMSGLSAWYLYRTREPTPYWPSLRKPNAFELLWRSAIGVHPKDSVCRDDSDYALPLILGLIEQWSYPILMAVGAWTAIGAWLGFKTIAHWH